MTLFQTLHKSLGTRLIAVVLAITTCAFIIVAGFTHWRLDRNLAEQTAELTVLTKAKLSERLEGEAKLGLFRLETTFNEFSSGIAGLAARENIAKAMTANDHPRLRQALTQARAGAIANGLIILDEKMRVVVAETEDSDIIAINRALSAHPAAAKFDALIKNNSRSNPHMSKNLWPTTLLCSKHWVAEATSSHSSWRFIPFLTTLARLLLS